ncbi:MAG: glycosyltransferase family 2 protein [Limisphaerales bacterium]
MSENLTRAGVIIPAYNHANYVASAVHSALAQGNRLMEVVVVDDGSTDASAEVVRQIDDRKLRLITQANRGPSAARNAGWRASRADWIQFLDADDVLAPRAIDVLLAAAEHDRGRIPFGMQASYPELMSGAPTQISCLAARSGNLVKEISRWYLGSIFAALIPHQVLEEIGGFDEDVRYGEDYDFAIRLASKNEFVSVPHITYHSRMHGSNRHRSFGEAAQAQYLEIIKRNFGQEPGLAARWRYRQIMASWLWRFGQTELERGHPGRARALFRQALWRQPFKLGAWRGWWHSQRQRSKQSIN